MKKALSIIIPLMLIIIVSAFPVSSDAALAKSGLESFKSLLSFLHENSFTKDANGLKEDESFFALVDVDSDNKEELMIKLSNGIMASKSTTVAHLTGKKNNQWTLNTLGYNISGVYRGGYVKVDADHNHSYGETIWPYSVYRYNRSTRSYDEVFSAYCIDRNWTTGENIYTKADDKDSDGVIYCVNEKRMTKKEYKTFVNQYIPAKNKRCVVWYRFTRKNLLKLSSSMISKTLAAPKITKAVNYPSGVRLTWKKVNGAAKYRVFIKSGGKWKRLTDTTLTAYTHKKAKSGKKYSYAVRCVAKDGKTYTSPLSSTTKKFIAAPVFKLKNNADGVRLNWSKVNGAAKYRVLIKSGGKWKKLADTATATYTHQKAKSGRTYTYTVRCISKNGKKLTSGYYPGKSIRCTR